ncbi:hypothetical protein DFH28DRAFT_926178 [Melampsora americana]|nr:hypothetical protein DFH28DRAFT_926178 [Melampsora americana]
MTTVNGAVQYGPSRTTTGLCKLRLLRTKTPFGEIWLRCQLRSWEMFGLTKQDIKNSIAIGSDDNDDQYNANATKTDDEDNSNSAGKDKAEEDQAPPCTPTPNNSKTTNQKQKEAARKKRSRPTSSQKPKKKPQVPVVKNFEHPDDVDPDQVTQDKGKCTGFRKTTSDDVAFLLTYYKDPEYVNSEQHTGIKQKLTCKWCNCSFTQGDDSNLNLYSHQDGYKKRKCCPGRQRAIQAGVNL